MKTNKFITGLQKTAGLPKWLHEKNLSDATIKGHSKINLRGLLKRRGINTGDSK